MNNTGYAARSEYLGKVDGKYHSKTILMHRVVLQALPEQEVDHKNGNRLDNQRSNLRIVTRTQNMRNRATTKNKTIPYKGVSYNPNPRSLKKYTARININGKPTFIGNYHTPEEAAEAYNKVATTEFGEHARLNEVQL